MAIKNNRNAIGIELKKEFYDLAYEKRFNKLTDKDYELTDTKEMVTERFLTEKLKAEQSKEEKKKEAEEKKELTKKKKDSIAVEIRF